MSMAWVRTRPNLAYIGPERVWTTVKTFNVMKKSSPLLAPIRMLEVPVNIRSSKASFHGRSSARGRGAGRGGRGERGGRRDIPLAAGTTSIFAMFTSIYISQRPSLLEPRHPHQDRDSHTTQGLTPLSPWDVHTLSRVVNAYVSPDGKWIAWTRLSPKGDAPGDGTRVDLLITNQSPQHSKNSSNCNCNGTTAGTRIVLSSDWNYNKMQNITWAPDSKSILFLTRPGNKGDVLLMETQLDGNELPQKVFSQPVGSIQGFSVSSDGDKIFYLCSKKKRGDKAGTGKSTKSGGSASKDDKLLLFASAEGDKAKGARANCQVVGEPSEDSDTETCLRVLTRSTGKDEELSIPWETVGLKGERWVMSGLKVSPDGRHVGFMASPKFGVDAKMTCKQLCVLDVQTCTMVCPTLDGCTRPFLPASCLDTSSRKKHDRESCPDCTRSIPTGNAGSAYVGTGKLDGNIHWSPNGRHLAVMASCDRSDPSSSTLKVLSFPPTGVKASAKGAGWCWTQFKSVQDVKCLEWADASTLLVLEAQGCETELRAYDVSSSLNFDSSQLSANPADPPAGGTYTYWHPRSAGDISNRWVVRSGLANFMSFTLSSQPDHSKGKQVESRTMALVGSSGRHPTELWRMPLSSDMSIYPLTSGKSGGSAESRADVCARRPTRQTVSNPSLEEKALGEQRVIKYRARDGLLLEGLLILPPNFRPPKARVGSGGQQVARAEPKLPLIVCIHGGPESHIANGWVTRYSMPGQVAAGLGYCVFYPNYRGSTGRGPTFAKLGQGRLAEGEFDDILDGIDYLVKRGIVDPKRVGVTGTSYGGYATAWLCTKHSDKIAAGVMLCGIGSKASSVHSTDVPHENRLVHMGDLDPSTLKGLAMLLKASPVSHVRGASSPLLIAHGKDDTRVHPSQALELFNAWKLATNCPTRLVFYDKEGHGLSVKKNQLDYALRQMQWLHYYLSTGRTPSSDGSTSWAELPPRRLKLEQDTSRPGEV